MKINIKGFTFVGFAAAIFAMNAMADDAKIVTSKSYVDAKISSENVISNVSTTTAPNEAAVSSELATKHPLNSATTYKVGYNSDWAGMTSAVIEATGDGAYIDITAGTNGAAVVGLDTSKLNKTINTETHALSGTSTKLVTEDVIADAIAHAANAGNFVDSQLQSNVTTKAPSDKVVYDELYDSTNTIRFQNRSTTANQVSDGNGAWKALGTTLDTTAQGFDSTNAVTAAAINTGLATKQNLQTDTTHFEVSKNGVWSDITDAVSGDSTYISAGADTATGGVKVSLTNLSTAGGDIDASDSGLTTGKSVYEYVQAQTGGVAIPAQDATICTTEHPCALVSDSGALHWYTMAQSGYAGGTLGDGCTVDSQCSSNQTCTAATHHCA